MCVESWWADYVLAFNTLLGNSNTATRLKTITNDFFSFYYKFAPSLSMWLQKFMDIFSFSGALFFVGSRNPLPLYLL